MYTKLYIFVTLMYSYVQVGLIIHNSGIHMIKSENERNLCPIVNTAECVCSSRQTFFHCGTDEVASYYYTHLRVV